MITTGIYLILRFNTAGVPKLGQEVNDIMNMQQSQKPKTVLTLAV